MSRRMLTALVSTSMFAQYAFASLTSTLTASLDIGNGYQVVLAGDHLSVSLGTTNLWSTAAGEPFISASAGNDSVVGSNGAFKITEVNNAKCQGQNISSAQLVSWDGTVTGSAAQIGGHLLDCGGISTTYQLTFWVPSNLSDRVAFYLDINQATGSSNPLKKLYFSYSSHATEDIYGLGAQASFASLKNQTVPIFSREQGVGRGDEPITSIENANGSFSGGDKFTTYTAIPSYITTDGNVFYLSQKSTGLTVFDFQSDLTTVRYDSLSVDGAFSRGQDMFEAVQLLSAATGRMPALPRWVDDGAILGIQGGQAKVNRIVEQGLNLSCPIAGVWLQDWVGTHTQAGPYINISRLWWNWEYDQQLYPEWPQFVQNLRDDYNVRTLSYVNTFLTNVSTKQDGFRRNLYDEAAPLHYFVQNTTTNSTAIISSGPGLNAGIIDLTNPGLRDWFTEVLKTQVWSANISGYMSDFGEYTPVTADTALYNMVSDAFFFHDLYPLLWAQYQREIIEDFGVQDEALVFHRSAATGANQYMNLFWVGDQDVNWGVNDGIKSVVTIMAHMGLSGYAHLHSDIGGYTTVLTYDDYNVTRSAELLGRWGELAAVSSPVFRSHEGSIPSVNAQFYSNASTYDYFAYNARLFVSLAPYRRRILETESAAKGWPLLRPAVMYYPDDLQARQISYQSFFMGQNLYVAPALDEGVQSVEVYFPGTASTTYDHVWTKQRYTGGQSANVSASYGKPPVFLVNGTNTPELRSFLSFVEENKGTQIQPY